MKKFIIQKYVQNFLDLLPAARVVGGIWKILLFFLDTLIYTFGKKYVIYYNMYVKLVVGFWRSNRYIE